jgi:hypothetical protein
VEDLQGRTPLERRMRSVGVVLDSVLFSQQLGFLHRGQGCLKVNSGAVLGELNASQREHSFDVVG